MAKPPEAQLRGALGILLEREIEKSGLSLNDFSRRAGVLPATMSRLVNGQQRSATRATLAKLAVATGHDAESLEFLAADIPIDWSGFPEVTPPPGVVELQSEIERAIDTDSRISPRKKRWLKQCVEMARNCP